MLPFHGYEDFKYSYICEVFSNVHKITPQDQINVIYLFFSNDIVICDDLEDINFKLWKDSES